QSNGMVCPRAKRAPCVGDRSVVAARGATGNGLTVRSADFVTPAPVTEIVTVVGVAGGCVNTRNPPAVAPAGMMTKLFVVATAGLLVESASCRSTDCGAAIVTTPSEPVFPTVVVGFNVIVAGGCDGVSVSGAVTVVPFQLAVSVTGVVTDTADVGTFRLSVGCPAGTSTVGGGVTAGELLDRLTSAPPGRASPFRNPMTPAVVPPVSVAVTDSDLSDGGCTVSATEDEDAPIEAVIVTGVGAVTWPTLKLNGSIANPAGNGTLAGTVIAGLLLVSVATVPPAGAEAASWTWPLQESPLNGVALTTVTPVTAGGAAAIVNEPGVGPAGTADVSGLAAPWNERTRQNLVPAVRFTMSRNGGVMFGRSSSTVPNAELPEICTS